MVQFLISSNEPFPKRQILDSSSKPKEFAADTFKFDKNGRKFFQQLENTVLYCRHVKSRACLGKG